MVDFKFTTKLAMSGESTQTDPYQRAGGGRPKRSHGVRSGTEEFGEWSHELSAERPAWQAQ